MYVCWDIARVSSRMEFKQRNIYEFIEGNISEFNKDLSARNVTECKNYSKGVLEFVGVACQNLMERNLKLYWKLYTNLSKTKEFTKKEF